MKLFENEDVKAFRSEHYNYTFSKTDGTMCRWGKTEDDDPILAPSAEILDIEISTICNRSCQFCYKGNSAALGGKNMSLATYQQVLDKFPRAKSGSLFLQQVALGIGSVSGNPELFDILHYTRGKLGVIPNLTVNGKDITDGQIMKLADVCGAIAVSYYNEKECFDTIRRLTDAAKRDCATLKQANIHKLYSEQEYDRCMELLNAINDDEDIKERLNAVVFLSLKPKGPRNNHTSVKDPNKIQEVLNLAREYNIAVGCDSCSAPGVFKWVEATDQMDAVQSIEPCESSLTSWYISVDATAYPCSFMEGIGDWAEGINMLEVEDFTRDVWFHDKTVKWRENLIKSSDGCNSCAMKSECRSCPAFDITPCKEDKPKFPIIQP